MHSLQLGEFNINVMTDGIWQLDGGAMFGIIPYPLWSKQRTPDEKRRIEMTCWCPLIRTGKENILIDCGLGRKWNEKQMKIYGIDPTPKLMESLASVGLQPEDITTLILSHLHLDHCGWMTKVGDNGELEPVFKNARHIVEKKELDTARAPNEIQRGTYFPENINPIDDAGMFETFEDEFEPFPGFQIFRTGGHTKGHCCIRIQSQGQKAIFTAEMLPTISHLPLPWIMAYDLYPLETLESKRKLLKEIVNDDCYVLLDHDPKGPIAKIQKNEDGKLAAEFLKK